MAQNHFQKHHLIYIITAIFIAARLFFVFGHYQLPLWDESVYIGMGKYIYSASASGLWESIRPIGLPLTIGLTNLMGIGNIVLASKLIALGFSVCLILATYILAFKLTRNTFASGAAALMLSISPIFFYNATMIMTEIPATFFAMIAIIFFISGYKYRLLLAGLFAGLATIFRFQSGMVLIAIMITIWATDIRRIRNNRTIHRTIHTELTQCALLLAGFLMIILPFLIFNIFMYLPHLKSVLVAAFRPILLAMMHQSNVFESVIDGTWTSQLYNAFFYLIVLAKNNILFLLAIPAVFLIKDKRLIALKAMVILMLLYLSWIINKQERFLIMFLPFASILAASMILRFKPKRTMFWILVAIFVLSASYNTRIDANYINWEYDAAPPIVDYYQSIDMNSIKGPILVTDPVFAAYTDQRLIPFYDVINTDYSNAQMQYVNEWESEHSVNAVAYSDYAFPCTQDNVEQCMRFKQDIKQYLSDNYILVYQHQHGNFERYLYVKNS